MTVTVVKGQKADLTKTNPGLSEVVVGLGWKGPAHIEIDTSAFLLANHGKVHNDDSLVFYNNPNRGYITYLESSAANDNKQFKINLKSIPENVEKIAFTLTIYEGEKNGQQFSQVDQTYLRFFHPVSQQEILRYDLGKQFSVETAIVVGELYRYNNEWKFNAIGSGFSGGLNALCANFGIDVQEEPAVKPVIPPAAPKPAPPVIQKPPAPVPTPSQQAPLNLSRPNSSSGGSSINLNKIELKKKGDKINLEKKAGGNLGEILINLNWNQKTSSGGFFSRNKSLDLDLACLYELKSGEKGVVQALGNSFGSLNRAPYIALDGDDRTGSIKTGENIRINGNKLSELKRILIFTFIYEGAKSWSEADGVVSIKQPGGPDIEVRLNEHDNRKGMCAIALFSNTNDETFSIERLVQFVDGHRDLDKTFNWGLKWVAGSK
ncbi:General stress protein 16U [compost metagenome]